MGKRKRSLRPQEFTKGVKRRKAAGPLRAESKLRSPAVELNNLKDVLKVAAQELIVALKEQLSSTIQENFELRNQLSKATKTVENLRKALEIERARIVSKGHQLRGARAQLPRSRKQKRKPENYSLVNTFSQRTQENTYTRTINFMSFSRFIQHSCLLSDQKMSLCIDLIFSALFGKNPPPHFVVSPSSLSLWNIVLGEASKLILKKFFIGNSNAVYLWGDDSDKGHEERHVFGVHTWDSAKGHPVGLVLGNYLISGGSGKERSDVEYLVAKEINGVKNITGIVSDNAQT